MEPEQARSGPGGLQFVVVAQARCLCEPAWLAAAEPVHRQLRPQLPADYADHMARVFADGGEMVVAVSGDSRQVRGLALFRLFADTACGLRCYVDDLVTHEAYRSQGVGRALLGWLQVQAHARGARRLSLESGTQRQAAHRFYFREGFVIASFSFTKSLD